MMKKGLIAFATLGLMTLAGPVWADGLLDGAFGNTVTISMEDGTVLRSFFFNEDGTVTMQGADGETMEGNWTLEDTTLCLTAPEVSDCNEIEELRVGHTIDVTNGDGTPLFVNVVEGR